MWKPCQRLSVAAHISDSQQVEGALLPELLQKVAVLFRARGH
jgi:hypothetical protein